MYLLGKCKFNRCLPASMQPPVVYLKSRKTGERFMNGMESIMFNFTKKNAVIEEQACWKM